MMTIDFGSGNIVTLPNVQWNDKYNLNIGLVSKISRHGTQATFLRSNMQEVRHYSVKTVKKSYVATFRTLLLQYLGQSGTINDGVRTYTGMIYTETIELVSVRGAGACESFDIEFDVLVVGAVLSDYVILTEGSENLLTEGDEDILTEAG